MENDEKSITQLRQEYLENSAEEDRLNKRVTVQLFYWGLVLVPLAIYLLNFL